MDRQADVKAAGATPLDVMLRKMRFHLAAADAEAAKGAEAKPEIVAAALDKAEEAAKAAGPYVHPRLAAIEHMGKGGGPIEYTDVRARLAHLIAGEASAAEARGDSSRPH